MEKKKVIIAGRIVLLYGILMLLPPLWSLSSFLLEYEKTFRFIVPMVGLAYFIGGSNILLRLKNWARIIVIIFSVFFCIVFGFGSLRLIYLEITKIDVKFCGMGYYLALVYSIFSIPSFLFLIFFTRPKVKEHFK